MLSSLNRWFSSRSKKAGRSARPSQSWRRQKLFEALEDRSLLAGVPTVISTNPVIPQTVNAISSLDITFSENVNGASTVSNYTLIRSGGDGVFGNGNDVTVNISGASNTNPTVTLNFGSPLPEDTYRLTLNANAVTAVDDGANLDGDFNGTAGGNYVVQFAVSANANDAPTVSFDVASYTAVEQTALNLLGTGIVIADVDAGTGDLVATLTTTAGGTLSATAGNSGVVVGGSGTSTVTLTGTVAELSAYLNGSTTGTLSYQFNGNVTTDDTLTISVTDQGASGGGSAGVGTDTVNINVTAVNDAPTVTITTPTYTATEQVALNLRGTGISVGDIDAGTSDIQVVIAASAGGTITATPGTTGVTIGGSGTGSVTLTGTLAEINALLSAGANGGATLTYTFGSDTVAANNTITVTANDLTGGANATATASANVNVAAINDAPTVTITVPTYHLGAGGTVNLQGTGITINDDATSGNIQATLNVSVGTLTVTPTSPGGVTVSGSGTGTVTLTGTLAQINALLAGTGGATIVYNPGATAATSANLSVSVNDQGNTGAGTPLTGSANASINLTAQAGDSLELVVGFNPVTGQWIGSSLPGTGTGETKVLAQWATSAQVGWNNGLTGDFNGDGVVDVVARTSNGELWVGASPAAAGSLNTSMWGWFSPAIDTELQVADVNADGRDDIVGYMTSSGQWWAAVSTGTGFQNQVIAVFSTGVTWSDPLVADFTGDGRADVAARTQFGQWWVGVTSNPLGTITAPDLMTNWATDVVWKDVVALDYNNDGKADIAGRADFPNSDVSGWWLATTAVANGDVSATLSPIGAWVEAAGWTTVVADTNGDGSDEIIGRTNDGFLWILQNGSTTSTNLGAWGNATFDSMLVGDVDGDGADELLGRRADGSWLVSSFEGGVQTDTSPATWASNVDWLYSNFGLDDDVLV